MKVAVFQFSLFGVNTYVVYDENTKECAVIDPGMFNEREEEALENFIETNHLKVKYIINTHLHIDHVAGNNFLMNKYNAPVLAHENEAPLGKMIADQAQMFHLKNKFEDVVITEPLKAGDIIKIGDGELEVLDVSGHSPGGIALYDKKDGFVITGDSLFEGSVGRTDLYGGNMPQLIENIKKNLLSLPDSTVVLSGHGDSTTIGAEKKLNPYLR